MAELSPRLLGLLQKARSLEKWPLAQLISIFESEAATSLAQRQALTQYFQAHHALFPPKSYVIGFTGTPGAGKSSLIGELCLHLLQSDKSLSLAIVAIDPSSPESGGAILGDRTRVNFPHLENRLFFRSQASQLDLGGVSRKTFQAVRLLRYFFDLIFIETVGIGQNELEIQHLSDHTCLILQPLTGDQIQFMKCGIMEIPQTFIINKCDEEALAQKSYHMLRSSLKLFKVLSEPGQAEQIPIFLTSATTRRGLGELAEFIRQLPGTHPPRQSLKDQEQFYLEKALREAYGRFGLEIYREICLPYFAQNPELTYELKEDWAFQTIRQRISHNLPKET